MAMRCTGPPLLPLCAQVVPSMLAPVAPSVLPLSGAVAALCSGCAAAAGAAAGPQPLLQSQLVQLESLA